MTLTHDPDILLHYRRNFIRGDASGVAMSVSMADQIPQSVRDVLRHLAHGNTVVDTGNEIHYWQESPTRLAEDITAHIARACARLGYTVWCSIGDQDTEEFLP